MAAVFSTDFDGGTVGASLADGSSGFPFAQGVVKPTYVAGLRGPAAMQVSTGGTGDQQCMVYNWAGGLTDTMYARVYMKMSTAVQYYAMRMQTTAADRAIFRINANGSIRLRSGAGVLGAADVGSGSVNATTPARLEWYVGPTIQRAKVFIGANQHGTVPDFDTGDIAWTPAGTFDRIAIGNVSTTANVTAVYDDFALDNANWIGPATTPTNVAPTAVVGGNQTVAAGSTGNTLSGSGSTDPDGTIASYAWTPSAGLTLSSNTVANPTFTAPATAGTYTASLVVTDNSGAPSTNSAVTTITVSTANAGVDQTPLPWDSVTITGTPSGGTWTQTSGETVVLGGSGNVRTFEAKPSNTPGSTNVRVFTYTQGPASDTMNVTTASGTLFYPGPSGLRAAKFHMPVTP